MRELVEWLNRPSDIHPVIASGIAQFQLVHIHPFLDGNGRTSRLLSTLCLYRAGYDFKRLFTISEYYDRDRTTFYQALQGVRRSNMDITGWIEFFSAGLATQLAEVKRRGETAIRKDALAQRYSLTSRQALALGHALEHGSLTIAGFQELCPGISRRTLQRDIRVLTEKGLLLRQGSTSRLEYVLASGGDLILRHSCDKTCDVGAWFQASESPSNLGYEHLEQVTTTECLVPIGMTGCAVNRAWSYSDIMVECGQGADSAPTTFWLDII